MDSNLTDKNGNQLKGAALLARLNSLEKRQLEQSLLTYFKENPSSDWSGWTEVQIEEQIPALVSLYGLLKDRAVTKSAISIQTLEPNSPAFESVEDFLLSFPIFAGVSKMLGCVLACTGGAMLFFLLVNGGTLAEATKTGITGGLGTSILLTIPKSKKSEG